jgi:hypothetical protein
MPARVAVIISVLILTGCTFGQRPQNLAFTRAPLGANAELSTDAGAVRGELVAVEDSGLMVLRGRRLLFVPLQRIQTVTIQTLGRMNLRQGSPENFRSARLVSRYPYGLSPQVLAALLRTYGQTAPDSL